MDTGKLLHDEIMANRNMAIDHPDLLRWSQDRIDALYQIKCQIDHYQPIASPETQDGAKPEGHRLHLPRVKHG